MPPQDSNPIADLLKLPEDQQKDIFSQIPEETRRSLYSKMNTGFTMGERYRFARMAGLLPQKQLAKKETLTPSQALAEDAAAAAQTAQEYQNRAASRDIYQAGKLVGQRSIPQELSSETVNALKSFGAEGAGVADKLLGGLMDWRTAAGILVSKLSPTASAAFFATQGAKGAYDAIRNGNASPGNIQNLLLGLSAVAGATGAGMSTKPATVGELKQSIGERLHGFARKVTESKQAVSEAVGKAGEQHAKAVEANKNARAEAIRGNIEQRREANMKIETNKQAIAEKNRVNQETFNTETAAREARQRTVDEQSTQLGEQTRQLETRVKAEADRRYEEVKAALPEGGDSSAPADTVTASVRYAQDEILQGIPEQIKEFKAILFSEGLPDYLQGPAEAQAAREGYELEGPEPLTWDKDQAIKTRLERRLRSNATPPYLKRAVGYVRDAVVDHMGQIAATGGAVDQFADARNFYRQYKEDFEEATGPSGSGSPVAAAVNAVDPKNVRAAYLRTQATTGNRAVSILRKYGNYGGNEVADLAETMIRGQGEIGKAPSEPVIKNPPQANRLPENKPVPAKIEPKTNVDIRQTAMDAIAATARRVGRLNAWDFRILAGSIGSIAIAPFIGLDKVARAGEVGMTYVASKFLLQSALENHRVANWIARTPPAEIEALSKLPNIDKVNVMEGLTQIAIKNKVRAISPPMRAFLGPENVAKILAATAGGKSLPQNRREALAILGR